MARQRQRTRARGVPVPGSGVLEEPDVGSVRCADRGITPSLPGPRLHQVRFQVVVRFPLPLPRAEVERAIGNGPGGKLHTELTAVQARALVSAFIRFNGESAAPAVAVVPAVAAKTAGSAQSPSTAPASPGLSGGARPSPALTASEACASTRQQSRFGVEPPVALRAEAAAVGPPVSSRGPASVTAVGPPVAAPGSIAGRVAPIPRAVQPVAAVSAAAPAVVPTAAPAVVPTAAPAIVPTPPPPLPASPLAAPMSPLERLQLQMMQSIHPASGSPAAGVGEGRLPTAKSTLLPLPSAIHVSKTSRSGAVAAAASAVAATAPSTMSVGGTSGSMNSVACRADDDACSGMNRKERRRYLQQQFLQRQVASAAAAASAGPPPGRSGWESNGINPVDSDADLCVVCLDNPREMRVNPCGHAVLCGAYSPGAYKNRFCVCISIPYCLTSLAGAEVCTSALRFKLCPSCRGPIGSFSKLA